ncbi:hypothetical protein C8J57DRAFT_1371443 [Mycena rebaudengoi]|nr:hypothetical protein C8J57DRAFT_1371443 [Mycena rebaudengoi]
MIVPSTELPDVKGIRQENIIVAHAAVSTDVSPDAPPPAYIPTAPASKPDEYVTLLPEGVKPTNFLSLRRTNSSIFGTYLIDPRLKIPASLLEPLASDETEETRRNLFLHTNHGSVDVDVFVAGDRDIKRRIDIAISSSNGSVAARIHADAARPPIRIKAQNGLGAVTIRLPRSFRGPITILTRHGTAHFSAQLSAQLTPLGEAQKTRREFLGDFLATSPTGWKARKPSSDAGSKKVKGSFFERLLGL